MAHGGCFMMEDDGGIMMKGDGGLRMEDGRPVMFRQSIVIMCCPIWEEPVC